jgi:alpha-glucosidase
LPVDAIWISPTYPSPMVDFGYDVADYCGVDARFELSQQLRAMLRRGRHKPCF